MAKHGKNYRKVAELVDADALYSPLQATGLAKPDRTPPSLAAATACALAGARILRMHDVAAALTAASGQKVAYTPAEATEFAAGMQQRGVPELAIERTIGFMTDIKNGQEEEVSPELENLLGRKPASLREGLKALFKL